MEFHDRVLRASLPLLGGLVVAVDGPLGRRIIEHHNDLSYQAYVARRQARWERAGKPVR
jgi:hypothetical protein